MKRKIKGITAAFAAAAALLCLILIIILHTHTATVTILQTSDIHGMLYPYDYEKDTTAVYGMAQVASVVKQQRMRDSKLLLIDTGDISRGNCVEQLRGLEIHPVTQALNYLEYDIWTIGNHEFNFEFSCLEKQIADFNGEVLAGNIYTESGEQFLSAYKIFKIRGVRVAVFGLIASRVPLWEKSAPAHYDNMTFTEPIDEVGKILAEIGDSADIIVGNIHYGLQSKYGSVGVGEIAEKYGDKIDALFIGHDHDSVCKKINGVIVLEPACKGKFVSRVQFTLSKTDSGWQTDKALTEYELINTAYYSPDYEYMREFSWIHEKLISN